MNFKLLCCQSAVVAATALSAVPAAAEAPNKALCTVQQAVACGAFEACERMLPGAVNLPALMLFDVDAGTIPANAVMWNLNQVTAKVHMFGQYLTRVFEAL